MKHHFALVLGLSLTSVASADTSPHVAGPAEILRCAESLASPLFSADRSSLVAWSPWGNTGFKSAVAVSVFNDSFSDPAFLTVTQDKIIFTSVVRQPDPAQRGGSVSQLTLDLFGRASERTPFPLISPNDQPDSWAVIARWTGLNVLRDLQHSVKPEYPNAQTRIRAIDARAGEPGRDDKMMILMLLQIRLNQVKVQLADALRTNGQAHGDDVNAYANAFCACDRVLGGVAELQTFAADSHLQVLDLQRGGFRQITRADVSCAMY